LMKRFRNKKLIAETKKLVQGKLILLSAPAAIEYYPKIWYDSI
jgi:hypothetical protein